VAQKSSWRSEFICGGLSISKRKSERSHLYHVVFPEDKML